MLLLLMLLLLPSCQKRQVPLEITNPTQAVSQVDVIKENGEMIAVMPQSKDTYYIYKGKGVGLQFLLATVIADHLGVALRVDVCGDSAEVARRMDNGEADVCIMPGDASNKLQARDSTIAAMIKELITPEMIAEKARENERDILYRSMERSPLAVASQPYRAGKAGKVKGSISPYDHLFMKYAPMAGMDWRMMAAQCYAESGFDTYVRSSVFGYCGLMAIIPITAREMGLSQQDIVDPEKNIAASAKIMAKLNRSLSDVKSPDERINFVLASYNAGIGHIRDAMMLAKADGRNPYLWAHVQEYVLKLMQPEYYRKPGVRYGYMRGTETYGYVKKIREKWGQYTGYKITSAVSREGMPHKAVKANKYRKE